MRIRRVLICVCIGMLATLATSWALHAVQFHRVNANGTAPWRPRDVHSRGLGEAVWARYRLALDGSPATTPDDFQEMATNQHVRVGWLLRIAWAGATTGVGESELSTLESLAVCEAGWPMRAMRVGAFQAVDTATPMFRPVVKSPRHSIVNGFMLRPPSPGDFGTDDRFALPLDPIWLGFAVNTAFYGAILFVLITALGMLRARHRRRHGRCTRCGYDRSGLNELAACPECGRREHTGPTAAPSA